MNRTANNSGFTPWRIWEPPILNPLVGKWAALIPLIVHLASTKGDHNLVGELALTGRIRLSLIPKLGHLKGVARLLSEIPDFVDRTSSKSELASTVWDVDWGSSFPCANGAARDCLVRYAMRNSSSIIDLEPSLSRAKQHSQIPRGLNVANGTSHCTKKIVEKQEEEDAPAFRRYQTLHVIKIDKVSETPSPKPVGASSKFRNFLLKRWRIATRLFYTLCMVGLTTVLVLSGMYGTAATVLLCLTTQIMCDFVPIERPKGYLENNEKFDEACMLSALHKNASTWYLYYGDRATIDWLLNKTMVAVTSKPHPVWTWYFRCAHYLQLIAMTFVAAEENWDGICLVFLLVLNAAFKLVAGFPARQAAERWIADSGVEIDTLRFRTTGRIPMLGAIQLLSSNKRPHPPGFVHGNIAWMDDILTPTRRRRAWANELATSGRRGSADPSAVPVEEKIPELSDNERLWVEDNLRWSQETYTRISDALEELKKLKELKKKAQC